MPRDHVGLRGLRERGVACPQWHCPAWVRAWSSPVLTGRIWLPVRGSGWRRCPTRARRKGGSIRWPAALPPSRSARSTAAGNDRFTAVGQWIRRASQADLARLRAPWDPLACRYRVPDEKTIRVVLDRLDPRALTRALLGPSPRRRWRLGTPPPAKRGRLPRPPRRAAGESAGPRPVTGSGGGWQDLPRSPPRRRHPGPPLGSPSTAGTCWITLRSMSSTTRPAISLHSWSPWTWTAPW